jgi:glycosyltransferase involved in cell wall biosynthesis
MNVLYHHRTRGREVEGVHIRGLANALRELGHRVDMVSPPGVDVDAPERAPGGQPARRPGPWSLLSARAPEIVFEAAEIGYNVYARAALAAQLRQRRYGLIYERYALFTIAGALAAGAQKIPLILEVNDASVVDRIRPLKLKAAAQRVERFVWNRADAVVTITSYFRDLIIESGVPAERVHVVPNAVDDRVFLQLPAREAAASRLGLARKQVIGYVGALNHWRRLDLLIDAFAQIAPAHPAAHLLIVGDGPDRGAIAEAVRGRGLGDRVTFAGKVPHHDVAMHLAAMDVAVIPHSNDYGSPMKLFEYMAAGLVVVAPWLPPIASVIGQDDGGVLFPPLDAGALAEALDALMADPAECVRLGQLAREHALHRYVWRRHAETVLRITADLQERRA